MHNLQIMYDYGNCDFATSVVSYKNDEINSMENIYKWYRYQQTYTGMWFPKCLISVTFF